MSFISRPPAATVVRRLRTPLFEVLAVVAIVFLAAGCNTAATGVRPAKAFVSPQWSDLRIENVAFLGLGSSAGDQSSRVTAEQIVEQQLVTGQDRFIVLGVNESRSKAAAAGAGDLYDRMVETWRNSRKADVLQVQDLCRKLGVDGLMFADLGDWIQEKVDWESEGTSFTQVAIRLSIFSGKNGLLAWDAQKIQRKDSAPYRPSQVRSVYRESTGAVRGEGSSNLTPDPPRPEDVATDAVRALIAAFPTRTPIP